MLAKAESFRLVVGHVVGFLAGVLAEYIAFKFGVMR
jgi:hypothetical protein